MLPLAGDWAQGTSVICAGDSTQCMSPCLYCSDARRMRSRAYGSCCRSRSSVAGTGTSTTSGAGPLPKTRGRGVRGSIRARVTAPHAPERGYEKAPAQWSTSLGTRGVGFLSRPLVPSLPRRHVLGKCACFCAEGIGSPSPAKEGGLSCGGAKQQETTCKAMMTDPPTDDTEAREQDAPDPTDAKHRAPLHGHTGVVPPASRQKALSDTPSPPAPPKEEPISQTPIFVGSQWEPDQGQEIGDRL
eukprot:scaffold6887_cov126-Isochrysis_galbana.AAC.5